MLTAYGSHYFQNTPDERAVPNIDLTAAEKESIRDGRIFYPDEDSITRKKNAHDRRIVRDYQQLKNKRKLCSVTSKAITIPKINYDHLVHWIVTRRWDDYDIIE